MAKPKQSLTDEKPLSALRAPWQLAFRYVGARIQRVMPYFEPLRFSLLKAGIKISLHSYVSLVLLLSGVSWATGLIVTAAVSAVSGTPILLTVLFSFGFSLLLGVLVFGLLYGLPSFLAASRRRRMNLELPYVASHMTILAAAGMPPTRMFKLLADSKTTPEVASEANEIIRDVEVLGNDIISALETERDRSPSQIFGEVLEGLVATIRSGGNMKNYLMDTSRLMMDLRRLASKQLIESLATFAEIYVTLLVVFPLLIIVMFSVMALIGGGLGGLDVTQLMIMVTYLIIPLSGLGVIVMLDSMLVED